MKSIQEHPHQIIQTVPTTNMQQLPLYIYALIEHLSNVQMSVKQLHEIEVIFKLYLLLYADDTVILAESREELQTALNAMYLYCNSWDLEVNPSKTKITIFCNRKFQHYYVFTYNGQVLEFDENFVYLGTVFSYNGRFLKIIKEWLNKPVKQCFLF